MTRDYCVYKHTCPNGKVYIGITKQNPLERWRNGLGYRHNQHFFSAIAKYGWDNITHEILKTGLTADEAEAEEIAFIAQYRSAEREFGYNSTCGGFSTIPNRETREKLSRMMMEQYASGKRTRERSEESKKKTSATLKKRFANGEIVRTISEEQRRKLSEAHKGKKMSQEAVEKMKSSSHKKAVVQYEGDTVLCVYSSIREAGRQTGIAYTTIVKVCAGKKRTAGGYRWKYKECGAMVNADEMRQVQNLVGD